MWDRLLNAIKTDTGNAVRGVGHAINTFNGSPTVVGNLLGGEKANYGIPFYGGKKLTPPNIDTYKPKIASGILSPLSMGGQVKGASTQSAKMPTLTKTVPTYQQNITIPASQGGGVTRVPQDVAQALMTGFDKYGEATNSAKVLHHPLEQTRTKQELTYMNPSNNYGENASFKKVSDATQSNGSVDRGLMRINSNTFNGLMKRHPDWMAQIGVNSWDQMNDPVLNAKVGALVLKDSNYDGKDIKKNPNYMRWFAAPLGLRIR